MPTNPYDSRQLAEVYEAGDQMALLSRRAWADLILSFSPVAQPAVLDVGVGTGMLAAEIATRTRAPTVGLDRCPAMLREAQRHHPHPGVRYVLADATALPCPAGRFDLALLSRVIHHLPDRERSAREMKRVLRPDGAAVVRTTARERFDALAYHYWPRVLELDRDRFPAINDIVADFTAAGVSMTALHSHAQPVSPHLATYHHTIRLRPQAKFEPLSSEEFATGLVALERDARTRASREPVEERYDVLVFTAG